MAVLLAAGLHSVLPRETTVLEILEPLEPDDELIATCRDLHQLGYAIALDDFVGYPHLEPLKSPQISHFPTVYCAM